MISVFNLSVQCDFSPQTEPLVFDGKFAVLEARLNWCPDSINDWFFNQLGFDAVDFLIGMLHESGTVENNGFIKVEVK